VAGFAAAICGYILIGVIASVAGADPADEPPGVLISATLLQDAALIASALVFARLAARPRPWQFGLRPARLWPATGWLLAAWVAFFVFSAAWIAALGIEERDDLPQELGADDSALALGGVAVLVTVVAPIAEEFFFRGYFFAALRRWKGVWVAALLTGITFGAIHAGSAPAGYLVPLALFGFLLCLLYWRTGSLYPCIVLHALNNSLALGVSQGWSWQIPLLMLGANAAIAAVLVPLGRRSPPPRTDPLVAS
jgi:membrane protease YdiL (CAAX protease family)